jgi:hypothetical protein
MASNERHLILRCTLRAFKRDINISDHVLEPFP